MTGKTYKLIYFNLRGRAELARLILAQAGVEYDDHRIERESWPELKPTTPFGQVPVLEVDGVPIAQSTSIARFLAKEFNLAGKDHLEQAQADMVVDACNDLVESMVAIYREQDETRKKELESKFKAEAFPTYLKNMEKLLAARGGKHFVGDELTWADIAVAHMLSGLKDRIGPNILDSTEHLAALVDDVINLPNIKKWIETRPKTDV